MQTVGSGEGELKRALSLPFIALYGIGTTVGAGIYVLVGEVAAVAGPSAPFSFVLAAVLAGLSALSFAELCGRFPRSAGEAVYAREAFGSQRLALIVGLMVVAAGTVSAATVVRGSVGYLNEFVSLPSLPVVIVIPVLLGLVAAWGITQAVAAAALLTVIELGGLLLVIWVGAPALGRLPELWPDIVPTMQGAPLVGLVAGGLIAFFAFIGFEDMVNVAEEVKDAPRTMPIAIVITLVVTTALYFIITLVTVVAIPHDVLATSTAPLARVLENGFAGAPRLISAISLLAIINGALIQIIMASRILYGLSRNGSLPRIIGKVDTRTQTPLLATGIVVALLILAAAAAPLVVLAKAASMGILIVFAIVNLALLVIKRRAPQPAGFHVPMAVPALGCIASAGIVVFEMARWLVV